MLVSFGTAMEPDWGSVKLVGTVEAPMVVGAAEAPVVLGAPVTPVCPVLVPVGIAWEPDWGAVEGVGAAIAPFGLSVTPVGLVLDTSGIDWKSTERVCAEVGADDLVVDCVDGPV